MLYVALHAVLGQLLGESSCTPARKNLDSKMVGVLVISVRVLNSNFWYLLGVVFFNQV